jgi:quercetin 2,3-dioxygenase
MSTTAVVSPSAQVLPTVRPVTRVVTAHSQTEGGGFVVRRPLPTPGFPLADPFLLIDEMGPVTSARPITRTAASRP